MNLGELIVAIVGGLVVASILAVVARLRRWLPRSVEWLAHQNPLVWRGFPASRAAPSPAQLEEPDEPVMALYVPDNPCERYADIGGDQTMWGHLAAAAVSNQVVKRCYVRLIRVLRTESGKWMPDDRFAAPIRLKWAFAGADHPEVEYRDLRPGEPALVDIAFTLERSPGRAYIAALDAIPIGLPRDLTPGIYLVTTRLYADNRDPVDCTFMLGVQPQWFGLFISASPLPPEPLSM